VLFISSVQIFGSKILLHIMAIAYGGNLSLRFKYTRDFEMENGGNIPSYKMNNVTRYIKMIAYIRKVINFMLLLV